MIAAIVTGHPRPIEYVAPDLPVSVIAVVGGCLVRERERRLTAEQLVTALEKAREDVASSAADPLAFPLLSAAPPPVAPPRVEKGHDAISDARAAAPKAASAVTARRAPSEPPRTKMEIFAACILMLVLGVALSYAVLIFSGR
jgi:hypothetical protein